MYDQVLFDNDLFHDDDLPNKQITMENIEMKSELTRGFPDRTLIVNISPTVAVSIDAMFTRNRNALLYTDRSEYIREHLGGFCLPFFISAMKQIDAINWL